MYLLKKYCLALLFLFSSSWLIAQSPEISDTSLVFNSDQYLFCELIITQNMFGKEQNLQFEYGFVEDIWGEEVQNKLVRLSELNKQKTLIDALNLMGFYSWEVVHTYTSSEGSYVKEHFVFQKKIIKNK